MLKVVDEYELSRMPPSPGVYAFHLRAIRRATVGLAGPGPHTEENLANARQKCEMIINRIVRMQSRREYRGTIHQPKFYEEQGINIHVGGQVGHTDYLCNVVKRIGIEDVLDFVIGIEAISPIVPPIYVGQTSKQTLLERYRRHKSDYSARIDGTFGRRLADSGFSWNDVIFSCSQEPLKSTTISTLEKYVQFFARPTLGEK